jgi:hypothetical protein
MELSTFVFQTFYDYRLQRIATNLFKNINILLYNNRATLTLLLCVLIYVDSGFQPVGHNALVGCMYLKFHS